MSWTEGLLVQELKIPVVAAQKLWTTAYWLSGTSLLGFPLPDLPSNDLKKI